VTDADDARRPFRIVVDVLATEAQVQKLKEIIGEAVCGAPDDHVGPCRIAWTMSYTGGDDAFDGSYGLDAEAAEHVRNELEPVSVWPRNEVDRSLGL